MSKSNPASTHYFTHAVTRYLAGLTGTMPFISIKAAAQFAGVPASRFLAHFHKHGLPVKCVGRPRKRREAA